ncbi:aromatic acid/H+ symport family MFS transporter [Paraburkholderia jirisanensis]
MEARKINIHEVIDRHRIGRTQYVGLGLCALLMLFDGFNTQTISYIVPVLANEWHLPKSILGTIFSAAFVGLLIGNFGISPLANRFGPKKMTVLSTALFGLFTLLTVFVTNAPQLIVLRLLTGIGLGAAAPCAIGLTSEFSPQRTRATFVLLIYVGYSLGFTIAGFCCGAMIPTFGWVGPLWVGGLGPIALTLLLIPFLPESASYLARRRSQIHLLQMAQRFFPKFALPDGAILTSNEGQTGETKIKGLFSARLRVGTFLLWAVFVINLAEFYFLQSWLPTVLHSLSYTPDLIVWATAVSTIGGMVAGLAMGPLMDRIGPYMILSVLYLFGSISMLAISAAFGTAHWILVLTVFCCGFCVSGGQKGVVALGSIFYPAGLRATGVAWAYGVGRLGGAAGTYLAGVLYAANWAPDAIFRVAAAPAVVAAICVGLMGWRYSGTRSLQPSVVVGDV